MINITMLDGSVKQYQKGVLAKDVIANISEGLLRNALAVSINGELRDINTVIDSDCTFRVFTFKDEEGRDVYRHTSSHILAQAVKTIYPTAKLAIGPSVKNGFYYDFDFKTPIAQEDLLLIEAEMQRIIKADLPIIRKTMDTKQAKKLFYGEPYKLELIEDITDCQVGVYYQGNFFDLCRGPHLASTGKVKAFKLTQLAGAYWRGDSKNKMLTRIYGTSFDKKSDLEDYLLRVEEAKKRDHNKLGRELGLFMTAEMVGQGLPLLMPKGARIIKAMQRWVEDEEERRGYQYVRTPLMAKSDLYKVSGHWDHYRDGMFILGDADKSDTQEVLALRPMECPFHFEIFKNGVKSYKDLPARFNETAVLFRNESSGEMHGLIRVRQFTLADGHIICRPDQVEQEFLGVLDLIRYIHDALGISKDVTFRFSRYDPNNMEKYINNPEAWEKSESLMKKILDKIGISYYEAIGEAAFYGPKLDVQSVNVYGKEDTLFTIQIDFALAQRFEMTYVDENGVKQYPYIIHRSSIGCYERTLAMLIEKYAGAFPTWLSPVQVKVISLTDRTKEATEEICTKLKQKGIFAESDTRNEKVGFKIREAQLFKIPYMLIIGDKEVAENTVSVRSRRDGDIGSMEFERFSEKILEEIRTKAHD